MINSKDYPTQIFVDLKCSHTGMLNQSVPKIGQTYWCSICQDNTIIISVIGIWKWKCEKCKAGRSYGVMRHQADRPAKTHAQASGHVVKLWRQGFPETITKIKPENDVEPLPF